MDTFQDVYDPSFVMPGTEGDDALLVEFFTSPIDDEEYVKITIPGDKNLRPVYPANDDYQNGITYKQRFHAQYKAFKDGRDQNEGQVFLDQVGWVSQSLKHQLNTVGIFTLEGLAGAPDANVETVMGGRKLVEKAKAEVAKRSKAKDYDELESEVAKLKKELAAVKARKTPAKGAAAAGATA